MRGERIKLPVLRKSGKQRGEVELSVSFMPCATSSVSSSHSFVRQSAGGGADGAAAAAATPLAAANGRAPPPSLSSTSFRSMTPDDPQLRDQAGININNNNNNNNSTYASSIASTSMRLQHGAAGAQQPGGQSSTTSVSTQQYPTVVTPVVWAPSSSSTHADDARSEASYSAASVSTLSRADSGGDASLFGGAAADPCITDLVRCSVDFRTELQQLLTMVKAADDEAAQGIIWTEQQIEEVAKVR